MKKSVVTLLVMLLSLCVADAKVLTPEESLAKAIGTMQNGSHKAKSKALLAKRAVLLKTEKSVDDTPLCYVFNTSDGGYIITGADDRAASILGYVDDCTYEESMQIPAFREWMENCKDAMTWLSRQPEVTTTTTTKNATATAGIEEAVEPLLGNITWGQKPIFNDMCPIDTTTNQRSVTGCAATAMAQIMRYWKWPEQGVDEHYNKYYPAQYVDFKESNYAWDKMLENYTGTDIPEENKTAVAKLMYDVGCSLDMQYRSGESETNDTTVFRALPTNFKYSKAIRRCLREFYTTDNWNTLLKTELSAKRPFLMSAFTGVGGGHAFVIDGYNQDGLYHVNWGWNGKSNSYFSLDYMDPDYQGEGGSTGGYSVGQTVILSIMPDTIPATLQSDLHVVGTMKYDKGNGDVNIIITNTSYCQIKGNACASILDENNIGITRGPLYDLSGLMKFAQKNIGINTNKLDVKEGYKIVPCFLEEGSSDAKIIPSALALDSYLVYKNGVWQYENSPYPEIVSVDTIQAYKCCTPKFKVTFKCSESRTTEMNTTAAALIYKNNIGYCYGLAQLHMKPGETQTVEISCDHAIKMTTYNLKDSRYEINYGVFYNGVGNNYVGFKTDSITLKDQGVYVKDKQILYDKDTYVVGDSLFATVTFVNEGGPIEGNYTLAMYEEETKKSIPYMAYLSLPQGGSQTFVYKVKAPAEPGKYVTAIYNGYALISDNFYITVTDPTGISDVKVSDDINGDVVKYIENGRLVIKKDGKTYSPDGARIK